MPTVPTTYKNPTGKQNLLTSFNNWIETNVPSAGVSDFTYVFMAEDTTQIFPSVHVQEYNFFNAGSNAFGEVLFEAGSQEEGANNQIMLDISIYHDLSKDASAKKKMYQIRDRIVRGLKKAGHSDDATDALIVSPIEVLDYDNAATQTGIVAYVPTEEDNHIIENPFQPTPEAPTVYRLQLLVKLCWYEMN